MKVSAKYRDKILQEEIQRHFAKRVHWVVFFSFWFGFLFICLFVCFLCKTETFRYLQQELSSSYLKKKSEYEKQHRNYFCNILNFIFLVLRFKWTSIVTKVGEGRDSHSLIFPLRTIRFLTSPVVQDSQK